MHIRIFAKRLNRRAMRLALSPIVILTHKLGWHHEILKTHYNANDRNWFQNWIYEPLFDYWEKTDYLTDPDPNSRVKKQLVLLSGRSGVACADYYRKDVFDLALLEKNMIGNLPTKEVWPMYWKLRDTLTTLLNNNERALVVQIGACSGREMAYFASHFPTHRFMATDASETIIQSSSNHYRTFSNLSFHTCLGHEITQVIEKVWNPLYSAIVIFIQSTCQLIQPEHLIELFQSISTWKISANEVNILLHEPGYEPKGVALTANQVALPSGGTTWSHNYEKLAKESGLEILEFKIVRPYMPYEQFWPRHQYVVTNVLHARRPYRKQYT